MNRWVSREGAVMLRGGVPMVEFDAGCYRGASSGCSGCAAGSVRRLPVALLRAETAIRLGDRVVVRVAPAALNRLAVACFAAPLAALLAGAAAARQLAGTAAAADLVSGIVGLCCLAVAVALVGRSGGALLRMLELHARPDGKPHEAGALALERTCR